MTKIECPLSIRALKRLKFIDVVQSLVWFVKDNNAFVAFYQERG
jgi:hypothetical protein